MRFETRAVHAGGTPDAATGSVAPPIHLSTTFEHGPAAETPLGYMYIRDANPTQTRLEETLAALEGGETALAFGSGMGAAAAFFQALPPGAHVVYPSDVYYGVRALATEFLPRWGIEATAVDMTDLAAVRAAVRPSTRLLWAESPSNPLMQIADLSALAEIARGASALLAVDGTFATPALQRPLELGADAVHHSTTKYLGGHSDVQGGALVFRKAGEVFEKAAHVRKIVGGVASPFNSWLVLRGVRTLACRVERQSANALAVARSLEAHPAVEAVHYPGLASHPGHAIARRQMSAFGGMLSFRVRGGRDAALRATSRLKVFVNATSLGGTESLIEHRASSEGPGSPTPQNLLRVSIGLEHPDDLVEDLAQALG
ncbi:MAG TPA: aminotransferase class I/II-fold pyridoxal phosphate-dependent enzyme [Thermoanaerobaculia bacterium]|nr:aminotransferase class I/II-fold pyridoxal phosphate-dependent enzyme [Thermoanaerobaculia bacterium]